ncbi:alpha/beta fold hydrolase [Pacificoceanicola onchidii]|uniref:alpha/beta fold hydrolase n=1 Tax=Pacificoceanicola onchidii TaxID=2562685 RepID=UPI0010A5E886|nr:alpha/beta hydrolase [Pacificoceanicola onchidii]
MNKTNDISPETMPDTVSKVRCVSRHGFHDVAYSDWGDPDAQDCLVCVHGLTRNARDFDQVAQALSPQMRVICADLAGRGQSDWLRDASDYNLLQYNMDMTTLLARTGLPQVDWLGTSLGGLIGISLAGMEGSPIRRLIINDVAPEIPYAALRRITSYVQTKTEFETLDDVEAHLRETLSPFGPMTNDDWAKMARTSAFETETGYHQHHDPGIISNFRRYFMFMHFNIWKYWDAITCPVLILRGTQSDFLTERLRDKMLERLPHASVIEFDGIGHVPTLNTPSQINEIKEWLADTDDQK